MSVPVAFDVNFEKMAKIAAKVDNAGGAVTRFICNTGGAPSIPGFVEKSSFSVTIADVHAAIRNTWTATGGNPNAVRASLYELLRGKYTGNDPTMKDMYNSAPRTAAPIRTGLAQVATMHSVDNGHRSLTSRVNAFDSLPLPANTMLTSTTRSTPLDDMFSGMTKEVQPPAWTAATVTSTRSDESAFRSHDDTPSYSSAPPSKGMMPKADDDRLLDKVCQDIPMDAREGFRRCLKADFGHVTTSEDFEPACVALIKKYCGADTSASTVALVYRCVVENKYSALPLPMSMPRFALLRKGYLWKVAEKQPVFDIDSLESMMGGFVLH